MFMELMGFQLFTCFGIAVSLVLYFSIFSVWSYIISLLLIREVYDAREMKAWCPIPPLGKKKKQKKAAGKEDIQRQRQNVKSKIWNLIQCADFPKGMFSYWGWWPSKQWSQWCCTWTKFCIYTENRGLNVYHVGKSTLLDYFSFFFWIILISILLA